VKWIGAEDRSGSYARSDWKPRERWVYLVVVEEGAPGDITGVCLTRIPESVPFHDPFASQAHALANRIVFPLGRGPGRPAGAPELGALVSVARRYAELFDAGQSLPGYPRWQQNKNLELDALDPAVLKDGERIRFIEESRLAPYLHQYSPRPPVPGPDDYNSARPRATDWQWADGTPLPPDRWPPAEYHGPLYGCEGSHAHDAHWIPPTPVLNDGKRSWCPGQPEEPAEAPYPGFPERYPSGADSLLGDDIAGRPEQEGGAAASVMLYIGTGEGRKRFACELCGAAVFSRTGIPSPEFACNGCGAQYASTALSEGSEADGCQHS